MPALLSVDVAVVVCGGLCGVDARRDGDVPLCVAGLVLLCVWCCCCCRRRCVWVVVCVVWSRMCCSCVCVPVPRVCVLLLSIAWCVFVCGVCGVLLMMCVAVFGDGGVIAVGGGVVDDGVGGDVVVVVVDGYVVGCGVEFGVVVETDRDDDCDMAADGWCCRACAVC